MTIKETFATADGALKSLVGLRAAMAEVVARPAPAPAEMAKLLESVLALQKRSKEALDPVAAHEAALKGLDRALIIANNDADIDARDKRLRTFESERLRIATLDEELEKLRTRLERQIKVEIERRVIQPAIAHYKERLAQLENFDELAAQFAAAADVAETADGDWWYLQKKHALFPELAELADLWSPALSKPKEALKKLAGRYTDLVEPKPQAKYWG